MLDQNTDRMWYVIGAVLIGAAIIFGMNTLMPNAFASVGESFQHPIEIINSYVNPRDEELYQEYLGVNLAYDTDGVRTTNASQRTQGYYHFDMDELEKLVGEKLTVSFEIKSPDGSGGYARALFVSSGYSGLGGIRFEPYPITNDWVYHTHTFVYTQDTHDRLKNSPGIPMVGLKSNNVVVGNDGRRYPLSLRRFQLELGDEPSEYSNNLNNK